MASWKKQFEVENLCREHKFQIHDCYFFWAWIYFLLYGLRPPALGRARERPRHHDPELGAEGAASWAFVILHFDFGCPMSVMIARSKNNLRLCSLLTNVFLLVFAFKHLSENSTLTI